MKHNILCKNNIKSIIFILFSMNYNLISYFGECYESQTQISKLNLLRIKNSSNYALSNIRDIANIESQSLDNSDAKPVYDRDNEPEVDDHNLIMIHTIKRKPMINMGLRQTSQIQKRVHLIWDKAEFDNDGPQPWLKSDKESVEKNQRAEEKIDPSDMMSRNVKIIIGNTTLTNVPNTLSYPGCGISISMVIVNGKDAAKGAYPWIALLLKNGNAYCAGSIINEYYILTASHCFMKAKDPNILLIRVGTNDRTTGTDYKVKRIILHERFNNDKQMNSDIALLRTEEPIKFSRLVKPVCLPSYPHQQPESPFLMVAGWGATEFKGKLMPVNLQEVKLRVKNIEECAKIYKTKHYYLSKSQLCTWNKDQDACQGDSGGPAIEYKKGKGTLVGIVSYGATCADQFPGVLTAVSYFLEWIAVNTKD